MAGRGYGRVVRWHRVDLALTTEDEGLAEEQARALFAGGAVAVERVGPVLVGHFLDGAVAVAAAAWFTARGGRAVSAPIAQPDWAAAWLAGHRPFVISARLSVAPAFVAAAETAIVLRIDPGLAFGTAAHPTTFLCLETLDGLLAGRASPGLADGPALLDVGCGTGILAIAALRLGCASATGTDVDPHALRAARRHARANGITDERLELTGDAADSRGTFPLVVANLPPPVLDALCGAICRAVPAGGTLVLSGFFAEAADAVERPYAGQGLRRRALRARREWGLLVLLR